MSVLRKYSAAAGLAAAVLFASATAANAVIIDAATVIPNSEVIINFNNTGLDWVYAGPIAPNEFGAGNIQPASYRAGEGWRVATLEEWASRPTWTDFTRPGFSTPAATDGFSNHSVYRFTTQYWSDYNHVDLSDYASGNVTDGVNGSTRGVPETIYVRTSAVVPGVPEPGAWALMIFGFGAVGCSMRLRRKAQALA